MLCRLFVPRPWVGVVDHNAQVHTDLLPARKSQVMNKTTKTMLPGPLAPLHFTQVMLMLMLLVHLTTGTAGQQHRSSGRKVGNVRGLQFLTAVLARPYLWCGQANAITCRNKTQALPCCFTDAPAERSRLSAQMTYLAKLCIEESSQLAQHCSE